eukprot:1946841-Rhodomonas_salina.2
MSSPPGTGSSHTIYQLTLHTVTVTAAGRAHAGAQAPFLSTLPVFSESLRLTGRLSGCQCHGVTIICSHSGHPQPRQHITLAAALHGHRDGARAARQRGQSHHTVAHCSIMIQHTPHKHKLAGVRLGSGRGDRPQARAQ